MYIKTITISLFKRKQHTLQQLFVLGCKNFVDSVVLLGHLDTFEVPGASLSRKVLNLTNLNLAKEKKTFVTRTVLT